MSHLSTIERRILEDYLEMGSGYVLDFTNSSFMEALKEFCGENIYSDYYSDLGDSKGKRLRCFFSKASEEQLAKVIQGLLEYSRAFMPQRDVTKEEAIERMVARLGGGDVQEPEKDDNFLERSFPVVNFSNLPIETSFEEILQARWLEVKICSQGGAYLSSVIMIGSMLEAILLGVATRNPREFNQAPAAPRDEDGSVRKFHLWSLANFIDAAFQLEWLNLDVRKHSHSLREFRNFIHPYEQKATGFMPTQETSDIATQVFRAAISQIHRKFNS